jgi:hypothetical protein
MVFEVAGRVVAPAIVLGHELAHNLGVRRPGPRATRISIIYST